MSTPTFAARNLSWNAPSHTNSSTATGARNSSRDAPSRTNSSTATRNAVSTPTVAAARNLTRDAPLHTNSSRATKNEVSTPTVAARNHSTDATLRTPTPTPMPTSSQSATQQQAVLNSSTPHNVTISNCTPSFGSSTTSSNIPKRHIFVDFGANDGNSVSSFIWSTSGEFDRNKLNSEERALVEGSQHVTKTNVSDWEAHVFEANPRYTDKLTSQQQDFQSRNTTRSYTLYAGTAIMTYDGTTEFILDNNKTGSAGATTVAESRSAVGRRFNVTAMDILTFFRKLNIRPIDRVIVKMDVEGAEYAIVQRMITHCIFPLIDKIAIEWHHRAIWVFGSPAVRYGKGERNPLPHERNERQNITHRYWLDYERLMKTIDEAGWSQKLLTWA